MWGYGATVARLTPDQKVGSSNLSGLRSEGDKLWTGGGPAQAFPDRICDTHTPPSKFELARQG